MALITAQRAQVGALLAGALVHATGSAHAQDDPYDDGPSRSGPAPSPSAHPASASPAAPSPARANSLGGPGESCRARADCGPDLRCIANVCRAATDVAPSQSAPPLAVPAPPTAAPVAPPPSQSAKPLDSQRRVVDLGVYLMLVPGVGGTFANDATAVSPGIEVAVGRRLRYHAGVGFIHLGSLPSGMRSSRSWCNNDYRSDTPYSGATDHLTCYTENSAQSGDGVDVNAATIGLRIPVYDGGISFELEPLVQLLGWTFLYGTTSMSSSSYNMMWQSGLGVRATLRFRGGYVAFEPANTQFRTFLFADGPNAGFKVGFGDNWPVRFAGGLTF